MSRSVKKVSRKCQKWNVSNENGSEHICYQPSILFNTVNPINRKNLLISLWKQLNWAIRACYSRNRKDSTKDLKIKHSIIPVEYLIKVKRTTYMWKLRNCLLPAFNPLNVTTLPTWCIRQNLRSCDIFFNFICHCQKLERLIIKTASKDWNSLPKELRVWKREIPPKRIEKILH